MSESLKPTRDIYIIVLSVVNFGSSNEYYFDEKIKKKILPTPTTIQPKQKKFGKDFEFKTEKKSASLIQQQQKKRNNIYARKTTSLSDIFSGL